MVDTLIQNLPNIAIIFGCVVLFILGLIVLMGYLSVRSLATARLEPIFEVHAKGLYTNITDVVDSNWAEAEGFTQSGAYDFVTFLMRIRLITWQHEGGALFLCAYIQPTGKTAIDIVTECEDNVGITTSSIKDGHLLPNLPTAYLQSFSRKSVDELYQLHLRAEADVTANTGAQPQPQARPISQAILDSLQQQADHVTSIPLWFLMFPWRYYITRNLRHNKTIAKLQGWRETSADGLS